MKPTVLVVDDSSYVRTTLYKLLTKYKDINDVILAVDGEDAIKKVLKYKPDVIILDLEMPKMHGFDVLKYLLKSNPIPVIILSSKDNHENVLKAMELGAVDFISKPGPDIVGDINSVISDIRKKIEISLKFKPSSAKKRFEDVINVRKKNIYEYTYLPPDKEGDPSEEVKLIVAIGSSTGGPAALYHIFSTLNMKKNVSIVVAQHMPESFTTSFAERLDKISKYKIKIAEQGEQIKSGYGYICPGNKNLLVRKKNGNSYIELGDREEVDKYIPSVDKLFYSVAESFGENSIGIILTGMGNDGAHGLLEIKSKKGYTIAESPETAVVYGMPKEAVKIGAVDTILPLRDISSTVERRISIILKKII